jgi:glyoxylase-like metal-dependent hydrolase (beta-lactamase superfamily II)
VFTSDAGTVFGPVPRILWDKLVAEEVNPDWTLTQALNCLLIETSAGRALVETGVGDRMDERRRAARGVRGPWIVPALEDAGFGADTVDVVAVSHLHFDHAGGLMTADGSRAFPRARIVAQATNGNSLSGTNPRMQASYEQEDLRLAEPWASVGSPDGDERGAARRVGAPDRRTFRAATRRSSFAARTTPSASLATCACVRGARIRGGSRRSTISR